MPMNLPPIAGVPDPIDEMRTLTAEVVNREFGVVAPDSGNQKIPLEYGTEEQKQKWLVPLTGGKLESGFPDFGS